MITKEYNIKRYCCFYVSEFHLEMIILPYIKKNIYNSKILIFTQENLIESIKILLDRINFSDDEKDIILNLKYWDSHKIEELIDIDEKYLIVINGNMNYIEEINKKIQKYNLKNITFIDCYNIEKTDISSIKKNYDNNLNTFIL